MKFSKILSVSLIALSAICFQSCLKDQEDIFEESPSQRMQATLDKAKKVLTSAENGWVFEYFPDKKLRYGGYLFTVKFDDAKATVGGEIAPGRFDTSLYRFTNDNGPMLAFDTYNPLIHFFSIPSKDRYQGYDGDYEFMIMDIKDDVVKLCGKRTGNTMYLRRLTMPADEYLDAATKMADNLFLTSAEGTVGGKDCKIEMNLNTRYMEFTWGDGDDDCDGGYYFPTIGGISFTEPVNVAGTEITGLGYDPETLTYTGDGISLTGVVADDYAFFNEFEGEFGFVYRDGAKTLPVTLTRNVNAKEVYVSGLCAEYDIVMTYDAARGRLELNSQPVAQDGSEIIWICGWGYPASTSLNRSVTVGMYCVKDPENPGTYKFIPNDDPTLEVHSLILWRCDAVGTMLGNASGKTKFYIGGSYQVPQLHSLVKK